MLFCYTLLHHYRQSWNRDYNRDYYHFYNSAHDNHYSGCSDVDHCYGANRVTITHYRHHSYPDRHLYARLDSAPTSSMRNQMYSTRGVCGGALHNSRVAFLEVLCGVMYGRSLVVGKEVGYSHLSLDSSVLLGIYFKGGESQ